MRTKLILINEAYQALRWCFDSSWHNYTEFVKVKHDEPETAGVQ